MALPCTQIGPHKISRLVCGSNCFNGFSHFSEAKSKWFAKYFTVERIAEVLEYAQGLGVNALVSSARPKVAEARELVAERTGKLMTWIATTNGSVDLEDHKEKIRFLRDYKAEYCLIHGGYTDSYLNVGKGTIEGAEELLAFIRENGMIPGLSTHRPEALTVADKAKYDVEVYILPINSMGFLCPVETPWVAKVIRATTKPVVAIKPLAAGRLIPQDGLGFVYSVIKDIDTVAVGVASPEEIEEDVAIAEDILTGKAVSATRAPYSPSKAILGVEK